MLEILYMLAQLTKEPAPVQPPAAQCITTEQVRSTMRQGVTAEQITGADASRIAQRLGGQADTILVLSHPQMPDLVYLVIFSNNCLVGQGEIPRAAWDLLRGGI